MKEPPAAAPSPSQPSSSPEPGASEIVAAFQGPIELDKQIVGGYIDLSDGNSAYQQLNYAPGRFYRLYARLPGVLSRTAQNVETTLGLPELHKPEPEKEEIAKETKELPV